MPDLEPTAHGSPDGGRNQTYTARQYRQLMLSYSGTQMMDERDRMGLVDEMAVFIDKHFAGSVTRPLVVALTTAILD